MSVSRDLDTSNDGERLVPGVSHDLAEVVRHKSSYQFFRRIIEADVVNDPQMLAEGLHILDLGCGVGHGSALLSEIVGVRVTAVDNSAQAIAYAEAEYSRPNIQYLCLDAVGLLSKNEAYDYIVSRHALEHIENGIEFAARLNYRRRLIVNVPYKEAEGNPHHLVNMIDEDHFQNYPNREFFFEALDGRSFASNQIENVNSIICVSSAGELPRVEQMIALPAPAWTPNLLERLAAATVDLRQARDVLDQVAQIEQFRAQIAELGQERDRLGAELAGVYQALGERSSDVDRLGAELAEVYAALASKTGHGGRSILTRAMKGKIWQVARRWLHKSH